MNEIKIENIQKYYNDGHSWREVIEEFHTGWKTIQKLVRSGKLISRSLSESTKLAYKIGKIVKVHTEESKKHLSAIAKKRGLGGDRPSKHIEYNGFKLCSTYELRVAKILDKSEIKWIKPKTTFGWTDLNNEKHTYHPDFFLPDFNVYLDPKNSYCIERDKEKIKRVRMENMVSVFIIPIEVIKKWENKIIISIQDINQDTEGL